MQNKYGMVYIPWLRVKYISVQPGLTHSISKIYHTTIFMLTLNANCKCQMNAEMMCGGTPSALDTPAIFFLCKIVSAEPFSVTFPFFCLAPRWTSRKTEWRAV